MREVCQRQIGDCTVWPGTSVQLSSESKIVQCLMNENSLAKLSSPVSRAEEGMCPSTVPCRGASPLLLHSSLGARSSRDLQDEGLPGRTTERKHRSGSLVRWALACQARRRAGGSGCRVTQCTGTTPLTTLSPASVTLVLEVYSIASNGLQQH